MAVKRGGLGKGLDSLIPDTGKVAEKEKKVKVVEKVVEKVVGTGRVHTSVWCSAATDRSEEKRLL